MYERPGVARIEGDLVPWTWLCVSSTQGRKMEGRGDFKLEN